MKIQLLKTCQSEESFSPVHFFLKSIWGNQNKIFAFSKDENFFNMFKKSLWSHDIGKLFPYVDSSNDFADLSPFVCSKELNIVNNARIIIVVNTVLNSCELSELDCDIV